MNKPKVFNYRKAEDEIARLKAQVEQLQGEVIRLNCDLDYYKKACTNYKTTFDRILEIASGDSSK